MHTSDMFGEIRSLLHGPQSPKEWAALWALVDDIPEDVYTREFEAYVHAQCVNWPDDLRAYKPEADAPSRSVDVAVTIKKGRIQDLIDIQASGRASCFTAIDVFAGFNHNYRGLHGPEQWQQALGPEQWSALEHVSIHSGRWSAEHRTILENESDWPNIKSLSLEHMWLPKDLCSTWEQREHLMNLEALSFRASRTLGRDFGRLLASTTPQWKRLNLNTAQLSHMNLTQLAASPLSKRLESLELERAVSHRGTVDHLSVLPWDNLNHMSITSNNITFFGSWLNPDKLPALRTLVARNMTGQGPLLEHDALLGQLEHLDLSFNEQKMSAHVDMKTFEQELPRLHTLRLKGSVHSTHAIPLLGGLQTPNLHTLDLSNNTLSTRAVQALANNPMMSGLRVLNLSNCGMSYTHVLDLCHSAHIRGLHRLELSGNPIDGIAQSALQHADLLSSEAKRSLTR